MRKKQFGFLRWHFTVVSKEVLKAWLNYLVFNFYFFSVGTLLKTLFDPWKRQVIQKEGLGFSSGEWFTVLTFNLISRFIGAFVRLIFIFFALVFEVLILAVGLVLFLVSFLTPIISLPTYLSQAKNRKWQDLITKAKDKPLLYCIEFLKSKRGIFLFSRLGISPKQITELLLKNSSPQSDLSFKSEFFISANVSETFLNLCRTWTPMMSIISRLNLDESDLKLVLAWFDRDEEERIKKARFWDKENLLRKPSFGADWTFGYTVNLDHFSIDYSRKQSFASHLVGRKEQVERMETILCRSSQGNVILVGEEGVGKKTVVYQLSQSIREGKVYPALKHKRVLEVDVNKVVGESKNLIEAQNQFSGILAEAACAGNIILVLPNFDRLVTSAEGRVDLSPVLDRFLNSNKLQVIGITTPDLYQKYIYPVQTIAKLFEKVEVKPPDKQQAINILEKFVDGFEKGKKVLITFQAIKEAVQKSDLYISEIPFPEKAIDLLDETVVAVMQKGGQIVSSVDIDEVLSLKTNVPVGEISADEKDKLLKLEEIIHKRLIDQEEAVSDLANAFRRARLRLGKSSRPSGVFLFLGPTGVGKTQTAKVLSEAYFGSENRLVRIDMSQFQDEGASVRLLGDYTRNEPGIMIKMLRQNPFCVLLLDEIEKASAQVLNLFLTAFDEGYITDNFGKRVLLSEMIIICTSNAGSEFIRQKVGEGVKIGDLKKELIDRLLKGAIFSPEFVNRFDSVVVYKPLSREHLVQIARLMLEDLNKRLKEREVSIKITDQLLDQVASLGFDPAFGARPMRRLIQDKIESPLAEKLLRGKVKKGEEMEIII